jgi:hypothetical protein
MIASMSQCGEPGELRLKAWLTLPSSFEDL